MAGVTFDENLYIDKTCRRFTEETAGKEPVPGGGSVSALVGALGAALGRMVGSLTVGKAKYADVEDEMTRLMDEAETVRKNLLDMVQRDIDVFEPLSRLYGMKAATDEEKSEKAALMEAALNEACGVPMAVIRECAKAIELSAVFAEKGSRLAVSDAGASAVLCKAAMRAASLNVYINTGSMKDRTKAEELNASCDEYISKYSAMADSVFEGVADILRR